MQNYRRTRQQKQKSVKGLVVLSVIVVILLGGLLFLLWQNTLKKMATTTLQEQTTSQSVSQKQAVSTTSQQTTTSKETTQQSTTTTSVQEKLVVKNGISRVGDIIIVNKKYGLPKDYNPGENAVAKSAFLKLKQAMQEKGFAVSDQYSGFRSYTYQSEIYNRYVNQDGQAQADRYSARPGHSEHQTGLAFDFIDTTGELLGDGIQDGSTQWLAENAHHYGFIVRYLKGKEHITGYMAETWHVRYVGDKAEAIYKSGLTLEEYLGVDGGDYND